MLTVSITHKDVTDEEKIALEHLLHYINNEFNKILIAEHDTEYSEHRILYQLHRKKSIILVALAVL